MEFGDLKKINDFEWEIGKNFKKEMNVPVRIFASEAIARESLKDKSFDQAVNAACLPGLHKYVCVMPDVHQGYGFPIGGVAASDFKEGIISPGAIGYDINCGVRLLSSQIDVEIAETYMDELITLLYANCPTGLGSGKIIKINRNELEKICRFGSKWAKNNGYASQTDIELTEDRGFIDGADPKDVSGRAFERGLAQMGSLGSGNHFIEVDVVEKIFDKKAASIFGLEKKTIALQIHCGSRGFGHQICSDYVKEFQSVINKYNIKIEDRELVCAPLQSPEGKRYLSAMRCAANFAFCNRQILAYQARNVFEEVFAKATKNFHLRMVYDLAHNMGKIEQHEIEGKRVKVCVHRKGATRAFGPGEEGVPSKYKGIGQPVLVPGSMGTASWVMVGTEQAMQKTFGTCNHGAGRVMSRSQAKKNVWGEDLKEKLEKQGIRVRAGSMPGLAEEAPSAYKDVDEVIESIVGTGIARKVARLVPIGVIKG